MENVHIRPPQLEKRNGDENGPQLKGTPRANFQLNNVLKNRVNDPFWFNPLNEWRDPF